MPEEKVEVPQEIIDEAKARMDKCIPIAKKILKMIGDTDVVLGESKEVKDAECYPRLAKEVAELMLSEDINYSDRSLCFEFAAQAFDRVKDLLVASLEINFDRAMTKAFGKDFMDIKLSDIDKILQS